MARFTVSFRGRRMAPPQPDQPQLALWQRKAGVIGGVKHVTAHGDLKSASHAVAGHSGDNGLVIGLDGLPDITSPLVHGLAGRRVGELFQALHLAAGGKRPVPLPPEDHAAHALVIPGGAELFDQVDLHFFCQSVESLGIADYQIEHLRPVLPAAGDDFAFRHHDCLLFPAHREPKSENGNRTITAWPMTHRTSTTPREGSRLSEEPLRLSPMT